MIIEIPPHFTLAFSPDIQRALDARKRELIESGRYLNPRKVVLTDTQRAAVHRGIKP